MRELLIAEMKRAIELLEANEKPFNSNYDYRNYYRSGELKSIMRLVRKHSVMLEKENNPQWRS